MNRMTEIMQADLDAHYNEIGEPATYNGQPVIAMCWRETGLHDGGEFLRQVATCRVRRSEVENVVSGVDTMTYASLLWLVDNVEMTGKYEHVLILTREYAGQMQ